MVVQKVSAELDSEEQEAARMEGGVHAFSYLD